MSPEALAEEADRIGATAVLIAVDDSLAGAILLRDRLRAGIKDAVVGLKELGITYQVVLTGDRRRAGARGCRCQAPEPG